MKRLFILALLVAMTIACEDATPKQGTIRRGPSGRIEIYESGGNCIYVYGSHVAAVRRDVRGC